MARSQSVCTDLSPVIYLGPLFRGRLEPIWAAPVPALPLTPSAGAGAQEGFETNSFHCHHHSASKIPAQLFVCCVLIDVKGFRVYFPAWTLWFWYIAIPACGVQMFKINPIFGWNGDCFKYMNIPHPAVPAESCPCCGLCPSHAEPAPSRGRVQSWTKPPQCREKNPIILYLW